MEKESEIREECYLELSSELEKQMRQWKVTWEAEHERNGEHLDKKIEILTRATDAEDDDKENVPSVPMDQVMELESDNQKLRREVEMLRREVQNRSPTKQKPGTLREKRSGVLREIGGSGLGSLGRDMERMRVSGESVNSVATSSSSSTSGKKIRKLPARKWDMGEDDLL